MAIFVKRQFYNITIGKLLSCFVKRVFCVALLFSIDMAKVFREHAFCCGSIIVGMNGVGMAPNGLILWENDAKRLRIIFKLDLWPPEP